MSKPLSLAEDEYLQRLEHALAALPRAERAEIIAETRSHVRDRRQGMTGREVAAVLEDLGPAEIYAAQFLVDRVHPDAIQDVGSPATRVPAMLLKVFQTTSGAAVALLCGLAIAKIVNPAHIGLWYVRTPRFFHLNIGGSATPTGHEILGYWLVPLALLLAASIYAAQRAIVHRARTWLAARANARI